MDITLRREEEDSVQNKPPATLVRILETQEAAINETQGFVFNSKHTVF